MSDKDKDVKEEPKVVPKPVKKLTAFELERIASRQRAHEIKVQTFMLGR